MGPLCPGIISRQVLPHGGSSWALEICLLHPFHNIGPLGPGTSYHGAAWPGELRQPDLLYGNPSRIPGGITERLLFLCGGLGTSATGSSHMGTQAGSQKVLPNVSLTQQSSEPSGLKSFLHSVHHWDSIP